MSNEGIGFAYLDPGQRFATSKEGKRILEELVKGNESFHPFGTQVGIFMLALAVGIITRDISDDKLTETIFVLSTYRNNDEFGVYPLVVKSMYPELDEKETGEMIEKFADAGLKTLYKEFTASGKIDFEKWIALSRK